MRLLDLQREINLVIFHLNYILIHVNILPYTVLNWEYLKISELGTTYDCVHIQFTIYNTHFLAKLLFTNKSYHLHVPEKCLYVLQEVRSVIYFWQFIHPLSSFTWQYGTSFALSSDIIISAKFWNILFLNNFYIVWFFYYSFIYCHQRKIRLVTLSKSYFYKFFFWSFFSLLSIFLSYLSLLLNSNKASKIIFKTKFLMWEKSILHCI